MHFEHLVNLAQPVPGAIIAAIQVYFSLVKDKKYRQPYDTPPPLHEYSLALGIHGQVMSMQRGNFD